ncbi:MAG TPA: hypothetical protein VFU71_03060 [Burkholderiaceae bacterium]|nr:hypothetical protein [Burkholderiaceae bacterium]
MRKSLRRFKRRLTHYRSAVGPKPGPDGFLYSWVNEQVLEMADNGMRVPYAWGMLQGALLGAGLGFPRVSMVEFGVAGGNGLVAMETIAGFIEKRLDIGIDIYGLDSGAGLPPPKDYRDVPNLCSSGLYAMDQAKLRARLHRTELVLGDIKDTVDEFAATMRAPLAFLACDFVLYSATAQGLKILDAPEQALLPRVHCYFDDVLGFTYGDDNGERLAIHEFNRAHAQRKISPIYGLRHYVHSEFSSDMWVEKFWIGHVFDHSLYTRRDPLVQGHDLALNPS